MSRVRIPHAAPKAKCPDLGSPPTTKQRHSRFGHVVKMTLLAVDRQGQLMPACARYIAIPGNNFISNAWRAKSEAMRRYALCWASLEA